MRQRLCLFAYTSVHGDERCRFMAEIAAAKGSLSRGAPPASSLATEARCKSYSGSRSGQPSISKSRRDFQSRGDGGAQIRRGCFSAAFSERRVWPKGSVVCGAGTWPGRFGFVRGHRERAGRFGFVCGGCGAFCGQRDGALPAARGLSARERTSAAVAGELLKFERDTNRLQWTVFVQWRGVAPEHSHRVG